MIDEIKVKGMILSTMPIGEQDKRLVLETCELGRITAFARGCRRAGSPLLAAANPFVMGEFSVVPGRDSFRLTEASVTDYFRELAGLQPEVYVGYYFLDFVDYYGQENIDGTDMLNLLYVSLKALLRKEPGAALVRRVFELRLMSMNGEYAPQEEKLSEAMFSICRYIVHAPLTKLFAFQLREDAFRELEKEAEHAVRTSVDRELKSRKIMEMFF